ncbi:MAG: ABC transporter permease [Cyclobacteriaceae bacterium]
MNIPKLSWKNTWSRPLTTLLNMLLTILGVVMISTLLTLGNQVKQTLERNLGGIDMVIGAKGSPLQIILSSVFHVDVPTGNIKLAEAQQFMRHRFIGQSIPLSYGDAYHGFRIIGTDTSYLKIYKGNIVQGRIWKEPMEVVVGSRVANTLNLSIGSKLESTHGLGEEGASHDQHFHVVGILETSGSVLDQLILTDTRSVWEVHHVADSDQKEITALLVKFRSPMGMVQLPRQINQGTSMQAALPAFEINKLMSMMGIGLDVMLWLGYLIIGVSGLGVFISLYSSFKDRKYEMALIRTYGGSRLQLVQMITLEGLYVSISGALVGLLIAKVSWWMISSGLDSQFHYQLPVDMFAIRDLIIVTVVGFLGVLAAIVPALQAARLDIASTLSDV